MKQNTNLTPFTLQNVEFNSKKHARTKKENHEEKNFLSFDFFGYI